MSNDIKRMAQRAVAAFVALALGASLTVFSLLVPSAVYAGASGSQVSSRSIKLSSASPTAGATVTYDVTFTAGTSATVKAVVVDFCSSAGDPIVGDSNCAIPTGFTVGASPTFANNGDSVSNNASVSGWTASSLNSGRTFQLVNATGVATTAATSVFNFQITNVTNPTASTGTGFYARVITYTTNSPSYVAGTEGTYQDYGGFALSTTNSISITAKVQESLTFCASGSDLSSNSNCAAATTPTLVLGHGSPAVLTNTAVDGAYAYTQASTNATNGLIIRMKAANSCSTAGLSANGGSTCAIVGTDNTTPSTITAGTTAFGLFVGLSALTSSVPSSSGTITPDSNYNPSGTTAISGTIASNQFGMDNTTAGGGVTGTYGDPIASSTGPVSQVNNTLLFGATAGLTVPAGIYTGSESLIATGTF